MRILIFILLVLFVGFGIVFGALNADLVGFDFGFAQVSLPKGASLLTALILGWLLGGFTAWWGVHVGYRRTRRAHARKSRNPSPDA